MLASASNAIVAGLQRQGRTQGADPGPGQRGGRPELHRHLRGDQRSARRPWRACWRPRSARPSSAGPRSARSSTSPSWGRSAGSYVAEGKVVRAARARYAAARRVRRGHGDVASSGSRTMSARCSAGQECGIGGQRQRGAARATCSRSSRRRKSRARSDGSATETPGCRWRACALGTVELHLPDVESLKGKRQVLKSLKEKVRGPLRGVGGRGRPPGRLAAGHAGRGLRLGRCAPRQRRSSPRPWTSSRTHVDGRVLDTSLEIL